MMSSFTAFLEKYKDLVAYDFGTGEVAVLNWAKMNWLDSKKFAIEKAQKELEDVESLMLLNLMISETKSAKHREYFLVPARQKRMNGVNEEKTRQPSQVPDNQIGTREVEVEGEIEEELNTPLPPEGEDEPPCNPKAKRGGSKYTPPARAHEGAFVRFGNPELAAEIWETWTRYKKDQKNFVYKSQESLDAAISKLHRCSGGSIQKMRAVVYDAMANGYTGFFPYKDDMTASVPSGPQELPPIIPFAPPAPDGHTLSVETEAMYVHAAEWFSKKCPAYQGRWLSRKEYEMVQSKDPEFIGQNWRLHCVMSDTRNDYTAHLSESLKALNHLPPWEKEKWQSVYEWLKKDVSDRIFKNGNYEES